METHADRAEALFRKGYNCSQSVLAAFAPDLGIPEQTALRIACGFGGGIGRMREVCGAFCGLTAMLGMKYADPADPADKSRVYAMVQELAGEFRRRNGGRLLCRDLLGAAPQSAGTQAEARTPEYYGRRPCVELVRCAADLGEAWLAAHPQ